MIKRHDYWQCGFLVAKGTLDALKEKGLEAFHQNLAGVAPFLGDRVRELDSWDKIKLLTVQVNRLDEWHLPGLLCIGDAAHAMSPVGGVGINLAVQDAVAASNILAEPLREKRLTEDILREVQERREWPTVMMQRFQVLVQTKFLLPVLQGREKVVAPWPVKLLARFPLLRRIPARVLGLGFRREHVRTKEFVG